MTKKKKGRFVLHLTVKMIHKNWQNTELCSPSLLSQIVNLPLIFSSAAEQGVVIRARGAPNKDDTLRFFSFQSISAHFNFKGSGSHFIRAISIEKVTGPITPFTSSQIP